MDTDTLENKSHSRVVFTRFVPLRVKSRSIQWQRGHYSVNLSITVHVFVLVCLRLAGWGRGEVTWHLIGNSVWTFQQKRPGNTRPRTWTSNVWYVCTAGEPVRLELEAANRVRVVFQWALMSWHHCLSGLTVYSEMWNPHVPGLRQLSESEQRRMSLVGRKRNKRKAKPAPEVWKTPSNRDINMQPGQPSKLTGLVFLCGVFNF